MGVPDSRTLVEAANICVWASGLLACSCWIIGARLAPELLCSPEIGACTHGLPAVRVRAPILRYAVLPARIASRPLGTVVLTSMSGLGCVCSYTVPVRSAARRPLAWIDSL